MVADPTDEAGAGVNDGDVTDGDESDGAGGGVNVGDVTDDDNDGAGGEVNEVPPMAPVLIVGATGVAIDWLPLAGTNGGRANCPTICTT